MCCCAVLVLSRTQELYNDNFERLANYGMKWMSDFLDAYPVLMVALYPLITITLRNNLRAFVTQFQSKTRERREKTRERRASRASMGSGTRGRSRSRAASNPNMVVTSPVGRALLDTVTGHIDDEMSDDEEVEAEDERLSGIVYTLMAALPPLGVAYATTDVQVVSTVTGAYAGLAVMFVIPCLLVFYARKRVAKMDGALLTSINTSPDTRGFGINDSATSSGPFQKSLVKRNPLASQFQSNIWIYGICAASLGIAVFNTYELATGGL